MSTTPFEQDAALFAAGFRVAASTMFREGMDPIAKERQAVRMIAETLSSIDPDNFPKAFALALSERVTVAPDAFSLSAAFALVDEDLRIAWVLFDDGTFNVYAEPHPPTPTTHAL